MSEERGMFDCEQAVVNRSVVNPRLTSLTSASKELGEMYRSDDAQIYIFQ